MVVVMVGSTRQSEMKMEMRVEVERPHIGTVSKLHTETNVGYIGINF